LCIMIHNVLCHGHFKSHDYILFLFDLYLILCHVLLFYIETKTIYLIKHGWIFYAVKCIIIRQMCLINLCWYFEKLSMTNLFLFHTHYCFKRIDYSRQLTKYVLSGNGTIGSATTSIKSSRSLKSQRSYGIEK
jgi:hypothetical protein